MLIYVYQTHTWGKKFHGTLGTGGFQESRFGAPVQKGRDKQDRSRTQVNLYLKARVEERIKMAALHMTQGAFLKVKEVQQMGGTTHEAPKLVVGGGPF